MSEKILEINLLKLISLFIIIKQASGFLLHNVTNLSRERRSAGLVSPNCYCDDLNKLCKFSDGDIDLRITNQEYLEECPFGKVKYCDIAVGMANEICGGRKLTDTTYENGIANIGEYPWHVAILVRINSETYRTAGAGVLVTSSHVLTVAHKIKSIPSSSIRIHIGDSLGYGDNAPCQVYDYQARYVIIHPKFNAKTAQNNLALIKLSESVPLAISPHINIACLPLGAPKPKKRCWVSGWNEADFDPSGRFIQPLKEVDVPIVDAKKCEERLQTTRLTHNYKLDKRSFLCAGAEPGKDSCTGDGGAPLVCERENGRWEVVGLVAGGIGCGQTIPGLYVNIITYIDWIREQIVNSC
ncbi:phenoloxidase-activating factor 2-like [Microplitis demolitor]|uniref:phenoloxidase-activating factor 2-like n=1 Tax=Microplitis demolitor TaxID=69319 RepID=UPI00235B6D29|nr:phenoloxidase-activating factor 2-like [Microplitis demolitor]